MSMWWSRDREIFCWDTWYGATNCARTYVRKQLQEYDHECPSDSSARHQIIHLNHKCINCNESTRNHSSYCRIRRVVFDTTELFVEFNSTRETRALKFCFELGKACGAGTEPEVSSLTRKRKSACVDAQIRPRAVESSWSDFPFVPVLAGKGINLWDQGSKWQSCHSSKNECVESIERNTEKWLR